MRTIRTLFGAASLLGGLAFPAHCEKAAEAPPPAEASSEAQFQDSITSTDDRVKQLISQFEIDGKHVFLLHDNLGLEALRQGDLGKAAAYFNRAIAQKPGYSRAYDHLAQAQELGGDYEGAVTNYTKALRLDPANGAHYLAARGAAYLGLNRNEDALKDLDKALESRPKSPSLLRHRSLALANLGRFAEAGRDYQKAVDLSPGVKLADDKLFCESVLKAGVQIAACK